MPTKRTDGIDKTEDIMASTLGKLTPNLMITTQPVVVCGVQRKINIGDFETIDVYCSVALPVPVDDVTNFEALEHKVIEAMERLISVTSKETGEKYALIREATADRKR